MSRKLWKKLLSAHREGEDTNDLPDNAVRSPFMRDYDRIIFSSAFRRLKDKTQVFPLAKSDYVRTRLTHSLEVASVGRSLGFLAGELLEKKDHLPKKISPNDTATIVATACLAHDIGNPPFGHAGEAAIQEWFAGDGKRFLKGMSNYERQDFLQFEGNAQGLRILSKLQHPDQKGGLRLTCAVMGTITKYPRKSKVNKSQAVGKSGDKFGIMQSEFEYFKNIAERLALVKKPGKDLAWKRHPFAFLVEAADDICYKIIDIEDGFKDGLISIHHLEDLHAPWLENRDQDKLRNLSNDYAKAEYLRAKLIGAIISEAHAVFEEKYDLIINGEFDDSLINNIRHKNEFSKFKELTREKVYAKKEILELETAGFKVIGGLLNSFMCAVDGYSKNPKTRKTSTEKLIGLLRKSANVESAHTAYEKAQIVADFVSGMTDSYALDLYQRISGISPT